jgi:hypothetical protein
MWLTADLRHDLLGWSETRRHSMSVQQHLESLAEKHRKLEDQILQEMTHPAADDFKLIELKRRKLKLKEQIARLNH